MAFGQMFAGDRTAGAMGLRRIPQSLRRLQFGTLVAPAAARGAGRCGFASFQLRGVLPFILVLCSGCGVLDGLILRPSADLRRTPADFGYAFEEVSLPLDDGELISVWRVPTTAAERKGVWVILPGNDGNKSRYTIGLRIFVERGWDVVLVDYEGFGASTGEPTLAGLIRSAFAAVDYAKSLDPVVVVHGISFGTPPAARVAAEREVTACVFEGTVDFYSLPSQFTANVGIGSPLFLLADAVTTFGSSADWDLQRWIAQVDEPKLFLHSPEDNVTPFEGAWKTFNSAKQPKYLFTTQGEHVTQVFLDPALYQSILDGWMAGVLEQNTRFEEAYREALRDELRGILSAYGLASPVRRKATE